MPKKARKCPEKKTYRIEVEGRYIKLETGFLTQSVNIWPAGKRSGDYEEVQYFGPDFWWTKEDIEAYNRSPRGGFAQFRNALRHCAYKQAKRK